MFKSKNALIGLAAAAVASVLLVAGLSVTATTGAATDGVINVPTNDLFAPPSDPVGAPPASPIEPPAADPIGTDPLGDQADAGIAPGALPAAGQGDIAGASGASGFALLLVAAGLAFVGAGATVAAGRRS